MDDANAIGWWSTNSTIPRIVNYWLMYLLRTLLTEHKVTNKITFSAVHDLPLPEQLSWVKLPPKTSLFTTIPGYSFSNLYALYPLSRQIFKNTVFIERHVYKYSTEVWKCVIFATAEKLQSKLNRTSVWWEFINALRS